MAALAKEYPQFREPSKTDLIWNKGRPREVGRPTITGPQQKLRARDRVPAKRPLT